MIIKSALWKALIKNILKSLEMKIFLAKKKIFKRSYFKNLKATKMLPDNPWLHCWAYYNFHYRKFFKLKTRKIFSRQSIRYKHFRKTRNASEKWLFSFLFSSFLCLNFWSFNATFKKGAKKVKFRQQHHGVYKKKKDNQFKVNRWVFFSQQDDSFFSSFILFAMSTSIVFSFFFVVLLPFG